MPEAYRELFRGSEEVVTSQAGWEPGSLNLAQGFSMRFRTPLVHGDVTRLLIDLGQDGDARWSKFSQKLPDATRAKVADRHERPYRMVLNQRIAEDLRRHDALLHVMIHTVPGAEGVVVLETPPGAMLAERFAAAWRTKLAAAEVDVRQVGGMVPTALAAGLGKTYPAERYAQVRLAVAQSYFLEGRPWRWETMKKFLLDSLALVGSEVAVLSDPAAPSTDPC